MVNGSRRPLSSAEAQPHLPTLYNCSAPICFSRAVSSPLCCMETRSLHPPMQSLPMKTRGTCRNRQSGWLRTFVTSIVLVASSAPHAKLYKLLYCILKTFKNNGLRVEMVILKRLLSGRSDGSVVKSNVCSSRGSKYNPHQPQGGWQPSAMGSNARFRFV